MVNKFGLTGIVAGVLTALSFRGLDASAQEFYADIGANATGDATSIVTFDVTPNVTPNVASDVTSNTRVVQEPLLREKKQNFYYDLSSERGYSVAYFVSVNNDRLCRIGDVHKIGPGDIQLQLVEKGFSNENHYYRII